MIANIPFGIALLDILTFVVRFLTAHNCYFKLQIPAFIIHRKRDDCQTLLAFGAQYLGYLLLIEQKFAGTFGIIALRGIGRLPGGDRRADEICLAAARNNARTLEGACPARRDFTSNPSNTKPASIVSMIE